MARRRRADRKLRALQDSGTLNPKPNAVRDPAFVAGEFFDPRDLVQVKYEMVRRVRVEGDAIAQAAARFGVSRPSFYKAQAAFGREGLAGLLPAKRGPRGPHKLTAAVAEFIDGLVADGDGKISAAAVCERIEQEFHVPLQPRTVERALARRKKKSR